MSLAQRLNEAYEAANAPKVAPIDQWVQDLDEGDRAELFRHIQASELPIRTLFEAVRAHEPPAPISRENFARFLRANGYKR